MLFCTHAGSDRRVCAVSVEAGAGVGRCALSVRPAWDLAVRFASRFCVTVVIEALVAGAYPRRGASAVAAVEFADRLADVFGAGHEAVTVIATAALGRHADPHPAGFAADRLADARVRRSVAAVACANLRRRARAKDATRAAPRRAGEVRIELVLLVTVRAVADVGRCAVTVRARTFAYGLALVHGVVVRFSVTRPARANVRLGAESVVPLALVGADRQASDAVRAHPVALVAIANIRLDADPVDAAVRAHRLAICAVRSLVSGVAPAQVRFYADSLLARYRTMWLALCTDLPVAFAAHGRRNVYGAILQM